MEFRSAASSTHSPNSKDEAGFVLVIHTSAHMTFQGGLGLWDPLYLLEPMWCSGNVLVFDLALVVA